MLMLTLVLLGRRVARTLARPALALCVAAASLTAASGQTAQPPKSTGVVVSNGKGSVAVSVGGGSGFAGTIGPRGFEGVTVGPDGKPRKIAPGDPPPDGVKFYGPGEFDPFAFARSFVTPAAPAPSVDLGPARLAIRRGDYQAAMRWLDDQARKRADAPDLDQARAAIHLTLGRYADSGRAARRALAVVPAWDWAKLRSFHERPADYMRQYQALKQAARDPKADADVLMALAYHSLVLGRQDDARAALNAVMMARPADRLAPWLLDQLAPDPDNADEP